LIKKKEKNEIHS